MRRLSPVLLVALAVLSSAGVALCDFDAGLQAYLRSDYIEAMRHWRPLAESGDAAAQLEVGLLYWYGQGLPEDRTEAARWLKKSASAEKAWKDLASKAVPDAQLRLGLIYWHGIGVPRDGGLALRHLEAAANGGSTLAAGWLCTVYMEGEIAPRNEAIALKWLEESARGSIEARAILGRSYLRGNLGVGKDYDKALALLEPAAKAGSLAAQTSLAEMYASGFGVVQNSSEAYRLFAQAADRKSVV